MSTKKPQSMTKSELEKLHAKLVKGSPKLDKWASEENLDQPSILTNVDSVAMPGSSIDDKLFTIGAEEDA